MTDLDDFEELPAREPAWAVLDKITAYRKRLLAAGYQPLPVNGKAVLILKWSEIVPTDAIITNWAQALPDHTNTGLLTRTTPTIDIDCLDPFAAETIENLAREQFGDRGRVLVRFGRKPKRAIPLRTDAPFSKIVVNFKAPNGSTNKIEVLGNGQQTVINGIHPDTKQPYEWFGGEPGEVCWQDLPLVNEQDLRQFVADATELLTREDYEVISGAPKADNQAGDPAADDVVHEAEWGLLVDNIIHGRDLHDSTCRLAAKLLASGMKDGTAVSFLQDLYYKYPGEHDERWRARLGEINRAVSSARDKFGEAAGPAAEPPPELILTLADWLARRLVDPDCILGAWLTTTSRVLIFAPTGIGKTMKLMALGMATAGGSGFLHWKGCRPARVLFVDGEMSSRLLAQRLRDEARRLGSAPAGFYVLSHEDIEGFAPLNTKEGQAMIEAVIKRVGGVDLIIFDNIMSLISGDQKDEEGWRQTLPWVRSLTKRSIGQIWVHHTGHDESRSYGTKTREWQLDTVIGLRPVEHPGADVSFELNFKKARERTPDTRAQFEDVLVFLLNDEWNYAPLDDTGKKGKIEPLARKFLEALHDACPASTAKKISGCPTATLEEWRIECTRRGLLTKDYDKKSRSLFSKYKLDLISGNHIASNETCAWVLP